MSKERFKLISAVHLFLVRDQHVLLLRRYNTGYEDGNYSVPAGHLDGGEEVKAAAIREAYEETGITIDPQDLEVVGVMHRRSNDERVDLHRLPENVISYVAKALHNDRSGCWFDSYGWQPGA